MVTNPGLRRFITTSRSWGSLGRVNLLLGVPRALSSYPSSVRRGAISGRAPLRRGPSARGRTDGYPPLATGLATRAVRGDQCEVRAASACLPTRFQPHEIRELCGWLDFLYFANCALQKVHSYCITYTKLPSHARSEVYLRRINSSSRGGGCRRKGEAGGSSRRGHKGFRRIHRGRRPPACESL